MVIIKCPVCGKPQNIDIREAIDENGEVFVCSNCKSKFRYTDK